MVSDIQRFVLRRTGRRFEFFQERGYDRFAPSFPPPPNIRSFPLSRR